MSFRRGDFMKNLHPSSFQVVRRLPGSQGQVAFLALLLFFCTLDLPAQPPQGGEETREEIPGLGNEPVRLDAFKVVAEEQLMEARTLAEKILRKEPDSYLGHFLMGFSLHRSEGSLPQAARHLHLAWRQLQGQDLATAPFLWRLWAVEELASIAGEMERFQEQLNLHEKRRKLVMEIRKLHGFSFPGWAGRDGWPLLRLRRYDAARAAIKKALETGQPEEVSYAKTTLCALEWELSRRAEAFEACSDAARYDREHDLETAQVFLNAAQAALGVFRFDLARQWLEKTVTFSPWSASVNPWSDATRLELAQGRWAKAADGLQKAAAWAARQPPSLRQLSADETLLTGSLLLLVAGDGPEAADLARRVLEQPGRTGLASFDVRRILTAAAASGHGAKTLSIGRLSERLPLMGWAAYGAGILERWKLRLQRWKLARRTASLLSRGGILKKAFEPYAPGGPKLPEWHRGELIPILGSGVALASVAAARLSLPGMAAKAYLDAVEAEIRFRRQEHEEALTLARSALQGLSSSEALLRSRVTAIAGHAAAKTGQTRLAKSLFQKLLQGDPGVLRRLELRLPVFFVPTTGRAAKAALRLLQKSPRLEGREWGLPLEIRTESGLLSACVARDAMQVGRCAKVTPWPKATAKQSAIRLYQELHRQLFRPGLPPSQEALESLVHALVAEVAPP